MFPVRKFFTRLLLTVGTVALCTTAALAAEGSSVPYRASVMADFAVLLESADAGAETVATLAQGDTLVLLSNESTGFQPAAWEAGEEVYTGYVDMSAVKAQSLGTATVLTEEAHLLDRADSEAPVLLTLAQGDAFQILGYDGSWYFVRANGTEGFLPVTAVNADVTTTSKLNLRSEPDKDGEILDVVPRDTELSPDGSDGEWFEVSYDGQTGYISSNYVTAQDEYIVDDPSVSDGEAVVAFAEQYLGNRYVWGGTSLENGCDCSGFVMQVYSNFGVSLPHSSSGIRSYGTRVSYEEMQPGDVVCYSGHVGIYAGDGQIINALNSRMGICYTNVNYTSIVCICRML